MAAAEKVRVFGIELLDIRFKRINYNESVRPKIYDRMISERRQIAERFLSEGNGEAARIRGNRLRDLNKIQSEAYRQVEEIRGAADAKATGIYASAYNQSPEAVEFYEFTRTLQAYKSIITENTTLVLSTDSDLFKFLKGMVPEGKTLRSGSIAPFAGAIARRIFILHLSWGLFLRIVRLLNFAESEEFAMHQVEILDGGRAISLSP